MKGYDVIAGEHLYFAHDAAAALRFAEFWASVGCDALFFEAEEINASPLHEYRRHGRVSYEDMRERVYYDEYLT